MFGVATSDDYQPLAWVGRYPIHVTTLLVSVHVVCMIIGSLLIAVGAGSFLGVLAFDSAQVLSAGRLWQVATYAFVHSPSGLIWFAIEMYMLFVFGREVERNAEHVRVRVREVDERGPILGIVDARRRPDFVMRGLRELRVTA